MNLYIYICMISWKNNKKQNAAIMGIYEKGDSVTL